MDIDTLRLQPGQAAAEPKRDASQAGLSSARSASCACWQMRKPCLPYLKCLASHLRPGLGASRTSGCKQLLQNVDSCRGLMALFCPGLVAHILQNEHGGKLRVVLPTPLSTGSECSRISVWREHSSENKKKEKNEKKKNKQKKKKRGNQCHKT